MKKSYIIYLLLILFFCSCDKEDVLEPTADFSISETEVSVNETVTFQFQGTNSKQVVIYTGDEGHDYDLKTQSNSGFVVNKGILTYSYKKPGTYKVVLVATNYNKEGDDMIYKTVEKTITVKDERADLRRISLKRDLFNKELLGKVIGDTVLFEIPYKIRVSGYELVPKVNEQRLEVSAFSDAAEITVDGVPYSTNTKYNLTNPVNLNVISASGNNKLYILETIRYAIFESFSINGVSGTVKYSDFNFEKLFINVILPVGTDVTALVPVFSSVDAGSIKVNDTDQVSGQTAVNFTTPVTYMLKTWKPGHENTLFAESEVEVTVTLE